MLNPRQRLSIMLSFVSIIASLIACSDMTTSVSFEKVEAERAKLINGIESYQNIDDFKRALSNSALQWELIEDNRALRKGIPPSNIYVIAIKKYNHLNAIGELRVIFFNGRLVSTAFYPGDINNYIGLLEKTGIRFAADDSVISQHTRIRLAEDYRGLRYVIWQDMRLDKEMKLWLERYS